MIQRQLVFALLGLLRFFRLAVSRRSSTYRLLFFPGFEAVRWQLGRWRAWLAFEHARKEVPAYRDFLREHGDPRPAARRLQPDLSVIPVTDKDSYVRRYPIEARCAGGRIPARGVVIDESSGTSGTPNNWVRGPTERREVKQAMQVAWHAQLGDREPIFFLNAFALGPWATGMNVSMSLVDVAILKSVGPDVAKIAATLRDFGPGHRYVIAGYPPFLKTLVDTAGVDWSQYDLTGVFGGEGMTEGMRDYLGRAFRGLYGSYGASDLEINLAAESDFTIAVRRLLAERDDLRAALLREDEGLPMIFQYNPIDYFVESSDEGELVVTLSRTKNAAPKIRYNIRDLGHVMRFPELRRVLEGHGVDVDALAPSKAELPVLFLYGRADQAVPYFGSKVTPRNVEEILYGLPELAERVNAFALVVSEDEDATKHLAICFELRAGAEPPGDVRDEVLRRLAELNQDFREASRFIPPESVPTVEFHPPETGPFAGHDVRLKRRYVQEN